MERVVDLIRRLVRLRRRIRAWIIWASMSDKGNREWCSRAFCPSLPRVSDLSSGDIPLPRSFRYKMISKSFNRCLLHYVRIPSLLELRKPKKLCEIRFFLIITKFVLIPMYHKVSFHWNWYKMIQNITQAFTIVIFKKIARKFISNITNYRVITYQHE